MPRRNKPPKMSYPPLVPEITLTLTVKLILILAAAIFVFSPSQKPRIDAAGMHERLLGAPAASEQARSFSP